MAEGKEMASLDRETGDRGGSGEGELFLRNHISYIVEKAWKVILVFIAAFMGNEELMGIAISFIKKEKIDDNMQMHLVWFLGIVVLLLVLMGWYLNRWYRTTMAVKDGTITYTRKTLTRKSNTMSVKQISNVNIEQNIFEMICGTCKMRLDTDSLSTSDETDMEMILKKKRAEQVKKIILAMKEGTDTQEADETEEIYDIFYTTGEMILNGLMSITVVQLVTAVGFVVSFAMTLNVLINDVAQGDFESIAPDLVLLVTEFLASFSIIWAIFKKIFQDFRFRAKRRENQIYVSCGLWKKKSYMVPVEKINAVKIEYPVIARIFGRGFLRVLNVGGEGEEADGMKLLLLGSYDDLRARMEILLPEYQLPDLKVKKRVPRQWMYIRAIFSLLPGAICGFVGYVALLIAFGSQDQIQGGHVLICLGVGVLVMLFWLLMSFMSYRTNGIGYLERELLLVQGMFKKEVSLIPYERIQYIRYQQGPLERAFGLQHGYVSLLASAVSRYRQMGSFRMEDFQMLEEKLRETY